MALAKWRKASDKKGSGRFVVSEGRTGCTPYPPYCESCDTYVGKRYKVKNEWICSECRDAKETL